MSNAGSEIPNSKYAWREQESSGPPKRSASERIADFLEIYGPFDEAAAREQASRCIQCPNPTCVTGCPLCNPIPQWMQLTAEGRFLEAAALLGDVTTMAEICTRVCPSDHLCEHHCILDSISEPVAIQSLERFLIDYAFVHGQVDVSTAPPNGSKVAVVGSGPGGLACAEELARKGYAVTVCDSGLVPGGLLINGVPAFRLDRSIVQRRLDILRRRGVVFRMGAGLGQDLTLGQLGAEHDAVYLAVDARKARPLEVPGASLPGVVQSISFLLQKTTPVPLDIPQIEVKDKTVVVIGGDDAAMDSLRMAIRYGARHAIGIYERTEAELPCGREHYLAAAEEGARFLFEVRLLAILADEAGNVHAVKITHNRPAESPGEGSGKPAPGVAHDLKTDLVIAALGFEPQPLAESEGLGGLETKPSGEVLVDASQMTSMPGVFAGGDLTRGPSTLIEAVRDARSAAVAIDQWVQGRKVAPPATK